MPLIYVGLGSNLGDREENLRRALDGLAAADGIRVMRWTPFAPSAPWGETEQPEFLNSVVEIETLTNRQSPGRMELNDLGLVRFRLAEPLVVDAYARNRDTGAFILIDEATNDTVGAGMVVEAAA